MSIATYTGKANYERGTRAANPARSLLKGKSIDYRIFQKTQYRVHVAIYTFLAAVVNEDAQVRSGVNPWSGIEFVLFHEKRC